MVSNVLLFDGSSGCVHFTLGQMSGIPWVRVEDRAGWEWHRAQGEGEGAWKDGKEPLGHCSDEGEGEDKGERRGTRGDG